MDKKVYRKRAKDILIALSEKQLVEKSQALSENLKVLFKDINSKHLKNGLIGAYAPIQQEVLWYLSFSQGEYRFCVPHIFADAQMEYHEIDLSIIKDRSLGLELEEHYRKEVSIPEVLLIPGLAFTEQGERLGRGKGYFDRYLSKYDGVKVGVCFSDQVFKQIPTDEHDELLDYLVTETNIYKISKG